MVTATGPGCAAAMPVARVDHRERAALVDGQHVLAVEPDLALRQRGDDVGRGLVAAHPQRPPRRAGMALEREGELREERAPALLDRVIARRDVRAHGAHDGVRAAIVELDHRAVVALEPVRAVPARVLDEDVPDLGLEPVVVPAEPARDLRPAP